MRTHLFSFFILLSLLYCLPSLSATDPLAPEWEIKSFQEFSQQYLNNTVTYPEQFRQVCTDGRENIEKILLTATENTYHNNNPIVPFKELQRAIQYAGEKIGKQVSQATWTDGDPLPESFFTEGKLKATPLEKNEGETAPNQKHFLFGGKDRKDGIQPFVAFEKKVLLKKNERMVFFGDLHGGAKTLIKTLEQYIEPNSFTLKKDYQHVHLAFLGDFVDAGKDGAEVIYLLARIVAANPSNVHLVRGNHEDRLFNKTENQVFYQELAIKYGIIDLSQRLFFQKFKLDNDKIIDDKVYNSITRFYEFMPCALFVGIQSSKFKVPFVGGFYKWRLACHGGIELGEVGLSEFLSYRSRVAYKLVGARYEGNKHCYTSVVARKNIWETINHKITLSPEESQKKAIEGYCNDCIPLSPGAGTNRKNDAFRERKYGIAYCWALFNDQEEPDLSYEDKMNTISVGKRLTNIWLKNSSTLRNQLVGIIRAHQHASDPTIYTQYPLTEYMFNNKGVWTLWQVTHKQNPTAYGAVTTLMAAPDTIYGVSKKSDDKKEKHYPGAIHYPSLSMHTESKWLWNEAKMSTEEITDILPAIFAEEHEQLMKENKEMRNTVPPATKKISWCNIL